MTDFDDPEWYPEDDRDDEPHPGDPEVKGTHIGDPVILEDDPWVKRHADRRERRRQRIEDHIRTADWRKRIRP